MASLTVRQLDDKLKKLLRLRAARHSRSMEDEVRVILREAAEQAGLKRGDVIVSVNGSPVTGVDEFEQAIEAARKEGVARLRVRDSGGFRFVVLKVS